jgi:NaMN:DMB phosphoribosyltransferase
VGAAVAADLVGGGARCLVTGDMGIGNTTPSAAVVAALAGRSAVEVTGRGTGIDDDTLGRKIAAVKAGLARLAPGADAVDVVAEVGGLEIAAIAGFVIGGAAARTPVVVDGVIALAGACVAAAMAPDVLGYCVAGHRSTEPGATVASSTSGWNRSSISGSGWARARGRVGRAAAGRGGAGAGRDGHVRRRRRHQEGDRRVLARFCGLCPPAYTGWGQAPSTRR